MASELRTSGISVVGDVPWGTHFCTFYETTQDLLDILVPFFKVGLEAREFCLWIISNSDLLTMSEATSALREALPDFDRHLIEGRIELVNHDSWFLEKGLFNIQRVAHRFEEKVKVALAKGFVGMRVNGSPAWLYKNADDKDLVEFEEEVDKLFPNLRVIASCTYPIPNSTASEILNVAHAHRFAITRRHGQWEVFETPELLQARSELKKLNEELEQRVIERTRELAAANEQLKKEVAERWRAEDRVRLIIDTIPVMAWSTRPDGIVDFLNQRWLDYAGLSFEQYVADPTGPIHPQDIPRVMEKWGLQMALGEEYEDEMRLRRVDGEYRWFLVRTAPLRDEKGDVVKWYGSSLDIEDLKRAEALLHAKEQEFRAIVENAPDQIIRYDRDFRRTYVNPAVAKAYGLPAEALIDKPIGSVVQDLELEVNENEVDAIRKRIASVFETGKSVEYEMSWPLPTGRTFFSVRFFPELDLDGSVINVLGISRDVTERKLAEEELKKEKEILEKIFANVPVMIGFVGADGRVKLVNSEWEHTIGWTVKELQEQNVDIFSEAYPDLQYRQEVLNFVAAATGDWVDLKIKVRDGRVIDAACAVVQLSDGTKVAIAQDITERKRAEQQLRTTSEQLRALSASLQSAREEEGARIAREIHDELGSALTSLKWDLEEIDKMVSTWFGLSELAGLRDKLKTLMTLTDTSVSALRRIASELRPSILDDLGLVAAIEWQAQQFEARTGIICDCSLENVELSDEQSTAVFRIFQEALTNVLRHAQATRVDIAIKNVADSFILTISDNGRGINEEEKTAQRSLGILGMRERAHLVGAEVAINGIRGKGTVVTVRLPISENKVLEKTQQHLAESGVSKSRG